MDGSPYERPHPVKAAPPPLLKGWRQIRWSLFHFDIRRSYNNLQRPIEFAQAHASPLLSCEEALCRSES